MFPFVPLHDTEQVRAIDRIAQQALGVSEFDLMQRAGASAWHLLRRRWPRAKRIGIVCGPGNNGGDGYVLARLAREAGCDVHLLALQAPLSHGTAGAMAVAAFVEAGGHAATYSVREGLPKVDLWVDALFGIGLHRALEGAAADLVTVLNGQPSPIFSLDLPSGIDADTGGSAGVAVRAEVTLSFLAAKRGLYTGAGRASAGDVMIDALGVPAASLKGVPPSARLVRADALAHWLPARPRDANKGRFGHVLCVGGEQGSAGAIALTAHAALRSGAGLVSVATRSAHAAALIGSLPEAMAHGIEDPSALGDLLERASVVAIGPGLGRGTWGRELLDAVLACGKPLVVDADALNLLAMHPVSLPGAIVTPHPGEASRLLDRPIPDLERDRFGSARSLSDKLGCTVVWKGAGTVVIAPGEVPCVIDKGNPGMATGGMGDALTGVIASLRAQGLSSFDAAVCGALLHGAAGDAAAQAGGERGLMVSDLFVPLRRLANPCNPV